MYVQGVWSIGTTEISTFLRFLALEVAFFSSSPIPVSFFTWLFKAAHLQMVMELWNGSGWKGD